MNTLKRLLFGILSSLLLAVGFARAADRLDPMTQSVHSSVATLHDDDGAPAEDQQPPIDFPCAGDSEN